MSTVILDAHQQVRLTKLDAPAEIRHQNRQVLGRYIPEAEYQRLIYALAEAACPFSPEELARRRQLAGGGPLAEFWARMGRA
jgi:hypothetical protein